MSGPGGEPAQCPLADEKLDDLMRGELMILPGQSYLMEQMLIADPAAIHREREALKGWIGASLEVAALLHKRGLQKVAIDMRYVGFEIPPEFVVGYGLDFGERYRNLPYVATLKPSAYGA